MDPYQRDKYMYTQEKRWFSGTSAEGFTSATPVVLSLHTVPVPVEKIDSIKTDHGGGDYDIYYKRSIITMTMINWREYKNARRMKETVTS